MERKIGEIFAHEGEWYQCVENNDFKGCNDCGFHNKEYDLCDDESPECRGYKRSDNIDVVFKKLEKVGEPIKVNGKVVQTLRLHTSKCECDDCCFYKETGACYKDSPCLPYEIFVEIKQNQEDMEEKKLNLKPFDLEAARNGKPVCTRDGRKARIICFDANDERPIIALLEFECENGDHVEKIESYYKDGKLYEESEWSNDLMMLPEKKEGWLNIYKTDNDKFAALVGSDYLYKTEKEAKIEADPRVLATVKIEWEE